MHLNEELVRTFYSAFQKRDHATMNACYHPEATFRDEAFTLEGKGVCAMWHMLCERGKDLEVTFNGIQADDRTGKAHWEAWYTFSVTGRKVHNVIDAEFEFRDGKIYRHVDSFDFWRWSKMALGTPGMLLGWSGFLRGKVRATAAKGLEEFIRKHPEYR